jgi:XTP/dITP diphosphohydrolase
METLCFATNNANKLREVQRLLEGRFLVQGLEAIGCHEELPETQPTIPGNSRQKAEYVWEHYRTSCFADDTGLEVEALGGEPGVYSARYAGPQRDSADNIRLLLQRLAGHENRRARFVTVITLVLRGQVHQFEGVAEGTILPEWRGNEGFGYDPVFLPDGHSQTFAEMPLLEKNRISHRGRAMEKLVAFLQSAQ